MIRTVAITLGAALCLASFSANAQTGYGVKQAPRRHRLSTGRGTAPTKASIAQGRAPRISPSTAHEGALPSSPCQSLTAAAFLCRALRRSAFGSQQSIELAALRQRVIADRLVLPMPCRNFCCKVRLLLDRPNPENRHENAIRGGARFAGGLRNRQRRCSRRPCRSQAEFAGGKRNFARRGIEEALAREVELIAGKCGLYYQPRDSAWDGIASEMRASSLFSSESRRRRPAISASGPVLSQSGAREPRRATRAQSRSGHQPNRRGDDDRQGDAVKAGAAGVGEIVRLRRDDRSRSPVAQAGRAGRHPDRSP